MNQAKPDPVLNHTDTVDLPSWAATYIFNADPSGFSNNDMRQVQHFLERYHPGATFSLIGDPEFTYFPDFGAGCECYTCEIWEPVKK